MAAGLRNSIHFAWKERDGDWKTEVVHRDGADWNVEDGDSQVL